MSNPPKKDSLTGLVQTIQWNRFNWLQMRKNSNNIAILAPSQEPNCIIMAIKCCIKLHLQFSSASTVSHRHLPVSTSTAASFQKSPPLSYFHIKISAHELTLNMAGLWALVCGRHKIAGLHSETCRYKGITGPCTVGGRVGGIDYLCGNT